MNFSCFFLFGMRRFKYRFPGLCIQISKRARIVMGGCMFLDFRFPPGGKHPGGTRFPAGNSSHLQSSVPNAEHFDSARSDRNYENIPAAKLGNRYRIRTGDFLKWWDRQGKRKKNMLQNLLHNNDNGTRVRVIRHGCRFYIWPSI